jgi:diguanylate cyclase (GGDEF)-like protein
VQRKRRPERTVGVTPPVVAAIAPIVASAALLVVSALVSPPPATWAAVTALAVVAAAVGIVRVARAVAAGEQSRAELDRAAAVDPLTGLARRDHVERCLADATRRSGRSAAVLVVDVDRFQHVNDTRGHRFGDAVLCALAQRLLAAAPGGAVVGRNGGDEFVVAVPGIGDEHDVLRLADRLLEAVGRPLRVDDRDVFLTATIGIATNLRDPAAVTDDLFREADTALHRAKRGARGGATVFDSTMRIAVERRVEVETQLRSAIDRGELTMHYQPVVDIGAGTVTGFEALMRWMHPTGELIGPTAFIEVAEETGLVVPMGAWALVESLYQLRRWIDAGTCDRHATMSVNVAAMQLRDPGLVACVMGALAGSAVPPHQLTLEITETALLDDTAQVERTIAQLVGLGVHLALDDFGTGYSSLAHLRRFPIDRIKVDRSFVGSLETSAADRALVRSIVAMARELGKDVVAEGVETREQLHALTAIGCAQAQGFLFSAALPAAAMGDCVAVLERATG